MGIYLNWEKEIGGLMRDFCIKPVLRKEVIKEAKETATGTEDNHEMYNLAWNIFWRKCMG